MGAVPTGLPILIKAGDVARWHTKTDALTALAAYRRSGHHTEDNISAHRATSRFGLIGWVLGRPDPLSEYTWLMRDDGQWLAGRLTDVWSGPAPWVPLSVEPIPATFDHVTRTVQAAGRRARYRTKSNGSCGRWVTPDDSIAVCACGWKAYTDTRDEARARARYHRSNPQPVAS